MKLVVNSRKYAQTGMALKFKVLFNCSVCKQEVEPNSLRIGRAHVYALHCGVMQEIGCIA